MPKRILWDKKNIRNRIVDKYFSLIEEFFQQIEKILVPIGDISIQTCMYIGLNSIYRVFEYCLLYTSDAADDP